jgi:hypothetical protein
MFGDLNSRVLVQYGKPEGHVSFENDLSKTL